MEAAVGIIGGAFASELLKSVIEEAKRVIDFDCVSKELASTMEDLLPIVTHIQSMQGVEELKTLMDTIYDANELVKKCSGVKKWKIHVKSSYTKRAEEINRKMLKFCGLKLSLIMYRDQGCIKLMLEAIHREICSVPKLDDKVPVESDLSLMKLKGKILDDSVESLPVSVHPGRDLKLEAIHREICSVPKLDDKVPVELDLSLMKLKGKILDDSVESLPVSVLLGGESSGVTQLCHGQDIKGNLELKKMNKPVEMVVGGEASASEILKMAIREAKMVFAFEYVSKELASTMEDLLPIVIEIESMQDVEELNTLMDIIDEARVLVKKCLGVKKWKIHSKSYYSRKVKKINTKMLNFCQVQLPLILLRNQGKYSTLTLEAIANCIQTIIKRIDLMEVPAPVYRKLCSVPKLNDKVLVGLDGPIKMLEIMLRYDSVERLLVSGLPGCGKTTLVTQLCHDKGIKDNFKHILYIVVSSTPKFMAIVQDLLLHNGHQAVSFQNDSQAANALIDLLKELIEDGPILLVLDDVWDGADSLLENFRIRLPGYKILVTSRSNLPSFDFTYPLKLLRYEDAKTLLIQWASPPHQTSPHEYEYLFQKILERCNGLPLLIEVVGVSLKGKPLYLWKGQVASWSEWETIIDSPKVLKRLEPSFSALNPHLKDCFMDMSSFLEDQKIRASVIIDIWVELYGKGTSSTSTSSSMAYMKYLNDLASQNLLELIPNGWRNDDDDGFYNEFVVTQHDILREFAIHESNSEAILERKRLRLVIQGDNYPDLCLKQRESVRFLSISTDDLFSSSWVEMDSFQFPNVEAVLLNISSSNYALPSFIATMKKLKVLIIINHGLDPAKLTNLSFLSSLPKLKRIRLEKVSITFLEIFQLLPGSLKKLSLFMCCFGKVSYDKNEIDVSKSLSSLKEIDIDCCYDLYELPYWISEAVSLETLSITKCAHLSILPEAIGNLSKLQVLRLCSCSKLSELPETAVRLSNLQFLDISHCSRLKKLPQEIGKLQKLKKISMWSCWGVDLPDSVINRENLEVKREEIVKFPSSAKRRAEIRKSVWEGVFQIA